LVEVKGEDGWVTRGGERGEVRGDVEFAYELLNATGKEESASGTRMGRGKGGMKLTYHLHLLK